MAAMAIKLLTGVYDDGADRGRNVPTNVRVPIRMAHRSSLEVQLNVLRISGVPLSIADEAATFAMQVRLSSITGSPGFVITGVAVPTSGPSWVRFAITPDTTKFMTPGRFMYEIWMTRGAARDCVVPVSAFLLEPSLS